MGSPNRAQSRYLVAGLAILAAILVSPVAALPAIGRDGACSRNDGLPAMLSDRPPVYLPLVYREPTPTAIPIPTRTPIPPTTVRVVPECCRFVAPLGLPPIEEFVCFSNHGSVVVLMAGWRVEDGNHHAYLFPSYWLQPSFTVRLHTKSGIDTATDLYWGRSSPIWNDDGDTVSLYDPTGRLIDHYAYTRALHQK